MYCEHSTHVGCAPYLLLVLWRVLLAAGALTALASGAVTQGWLGASWTELKTSATLEGWLPLHSSLLHSIGSIPTKLQ